MASFPRYLTLPPPLHVLSYQPKHQLEKIMLRCLAQSNSRSVSFPRLRRAQKGMNDFLPSNGADNRLNACHPHVFV